MQNIEMNRKYCCVPGCRPLIGDPPLRTHFFPKKENPVRRSVWLKFCGIQEDTLSPVHFICSKHFPDDAYQPAFRVLGRDRKAWKLMYDAVPTLLPPILDETVMVTPMEEPIEIELKVPETIPIPPTSKCRLCLCPLDLDTANGVSLFAADQDSQSSVCDQLLSWFRLELEESPEWPSLICPTCVETVAQINRFKERIVASHCSLHKEIVPKITMENENQDESQGESDKEDEAELVGVQRTKNRIMNTVRLPRSAEKRAELEQVMLSMQLGKCVPCKVDFTCYLELKTHHLEVHKNHFAFVQCCGERRFGLVDILDHMEFHQNGSRFKCSGCELCLDSYENLLKHRKAEHPEQRYQCAECGRAVASPFILKKHFLKHLPKDQRPSKCAQCPKAFCSNQALARHVERMHDIAKRHICEVCGKGYSNSSTLWTHMDNHKNGNRHNVRRIMGKNGQEPRRKRVLKPKGFVCKFCGIPFDNYKKHRNHENQHLGRKFPCPKCDKVNETPEGRGWHIKTHHPEEFASTVRMSKELQKLPYGNH